MKHIKFTYFLLYLPIIYSCNSHQHIKVMGADTISVRTMELRQHKGDQQIAVSGQFTTDDEVMLSFKTNGIISILNVKEGDAVHKGQLLAALNPLEINAQVKQAKLAAEKAQRDYLRNQSLFKDSVATLQQLQDSKTATQQADQALGIALFNRQYSEIRASKDGYILHKLANIGQQVTAGTAILEINGAEAGNWMLRVSMSDREWAMLKTNDIAEIQTSALPGQLLQGVVNHKSEGVDAATGTFSAYIKLTGKKTQVIASGMFGKAVITVTQNSSADSTWQIPYEALLDGDSTTGYVFITNDNRTARKVQVTVLNIEKNKVMISGPLKDAKSLIISGSAYLTDHSPIVIQSAKTVNQ